MIERRQGKARGGRKGFEYMHELGVNRAARTNSKVKSS